MNTPVYSPRALRRALWRSIEPIRSRPVADLRHPLDLSDAIMVPTHTLPAAPTRDDLRAFGLGAVLALVLGFIEENKEEIVRRINAVVGLPFIPEATEAKLIRLVVEGLISMLREWAGEGGPEGPTSNAGGPYTGPGAAEFQG